MLDSRILMICTNEGTLGLTMDTCIHSLHFPFPQTCASQGVILDSGLDLPLNMDLKSKSVYNQIQTGFSGVFYSGLPRLSNNGIILAVSGMVLWAHRASNARMCTIPTAMNMAFCLASC